MEKNVPMSSKSKGKLSLDLEDIGFNPDHVYNHMTYKNSTIQWIRILPFYLL